MSDEMMNDTLQKLEYALKRGEVLTHIESFIEYIEASYHTGELEAALQMTRRMSSSGLKEDALQDVLSRRAELLSHLGRYDEEFHECIRQVLQGSSGTAKSRALRTLGRYHLDVGDNATGEHFLRRAMDQPEVGPVDRLLCLYELGLAFDGHYLYEKSSIPLIEMLKSAQLSEQSDLLVGMCLHANALLLLNQGRFEEANVVFHEAIRLVEQTRGRYHPSFAACLSGVARLFRAEGKASAGVPILQLRTAIHSKILGETHNTYAESLTSLALAVVQQGNVEDAITYLERACSIFEKNDACDLRSAKAFETLAALLMRQNDYAKAESAAFSAMTQYHRMKQEVGQAIILRILAEIFLKLGKLQDALVFAERAAKLAPEKLDEKHPLIGGTQFTLGLTRQAQGLYKEALEAFNNALSQAQKLGTDQDLIRSSLHNIGGVLGRLGRYKEAEKALKDLLEHEKVHNNGESSPETWATLGGIQARLGEFEAAKQNLEKALQCLNANRANSETLQASGQPAMSAQKSNKEGEQTAVESEECMMIRCSIADCLITQGQLNKAQEALCYENIEQAEEHLREKPPLFALWSSVYAHILSDRGLYVEAEGALRQGLRSAEMHFGKKHPEVSAMYRQLAVLRAQRGDYDEALDLAKSALQIDRSKFGEEYTSIRASQFTLARMLMLRGEYENAKKILRKLLAKDQVLFDEYYWDNAQTHSAMAETLEALSQYDQAEAHAKKALMIDQKNFTAPHPSKVNNMMLIARILDASDRPQEALPMVEEALTQAEAVYSETHPAWAELFAVKGVCCQHLERHQEAQSCLQNALMIVDESLGLHHPRRIALLSRLAYVVLDLEKSLPEPDLNLVQDAEVLAREAKSVASEALGQNHPGMASVLHTLALILKREGKLEDARNLIKKVIKLKAEQLGTDHADYAISLSLLGQIESDQKNEAAAAETLKRALVLLTLTLGERHRETKRARNALQKLSLSSDHQL